MTTYSGEKLKLRRAKRKDRDFLCRVYASTRLEELAQSGWPQEQIDAFLKSQFEFQDKHYQEYYGDSTFSVICHDQEDVGRLYIQRRSDEIRIVDIALLPEYRGFGLGSFLLREILDEARLANKAVRIHVEKNNPAMRLYRSLGFKELDDTGVYKLMEWVPKSATTTEAKLHRSLTEK